METVKGPVPGQVTMIPAYVQFAKLGLVNKFLSVILTYVAISMPGALLLLVSNFCCFRNRL